MMEIAANCAYDEEIANDAVCAKIAFSALLIFPRATSAYLAYEDVSANADDTFIAFTEIERPPIELDTDVVRTMLDVTNTVIGISPLDELTEDRRLLSLTTMRIFGGNDIISYKSVTPRSTFTFPSRIR